VQACSLMSFSCSLPVICRPVVGLPEDALVLFGAGRLVLVVLLPGAKEADEEEEERCEKKKKRSSGSSSPAKMATLSTLIRPN